MSSKVSYLSPVVDLRVSSVKTSTNRVENASGKEDRFGKRYQVIKFLPLYKLNISGQGSTAVEINQTVEGLTSGAKGRIVKYQNGTIWLKLSTPSTFIPAEYLFFSSQSQTGGSLEGTEVFIQNGGVSLQSSSFTIGSTIVAFNPSDTNQKYTNKISGKIINWDSASRELIVENDKAPINNDYMSRITLGSAFSRNPVVANQSPDIFRVGDLIYFDEIATGEELFTEVGSMEFTNGVDFVPENASKNTSALAKYVTKEISINEPGTSIDVRLTANIKDVNNVSVLYKLKEVSSQVNFDDNDWQYFNTTGNPDTFELATYENRISGQIETQAAYQELKYSVSNLPEFGSFAIKIVMKTNDPVYPPKIQDIRAVAAY